MKSALALASLFFATALPAFASPASIPIPAARDPKLVDAINPNLNTAINPNFNTMINPRANGRLNPIYNAVINPRVRNSLNPRTNNSVNPKTNSAIDPDINQDINPAFNTFLNPSMNLSPTIPVTFVLDLSLEPTGFLVNVSPNVQIEYDATLRPLWLFVGDSMGGYNVFDYSSLEWFAYTKPNGTQGQNLFTLDGYWFGFTE